MYLNTATSNGPVASNSEKSGRLSNNDGTTSSRPSSQDSSAGRPSPDEFKPSTDLPPAAGISQAVPPTSRHPAMNLDPAVPLSNGPVAGPSTVSHGPEPAACPVPVAAPPAAAPQKNVQQNDYDRFGGTRISFLPPVLNIKKEVMDPVLDGPSDDPANMSSNFDLSNSGGTGPSTSHGSSGMNHFSPSTSQYEEPPGGGRNCETDSCSEPHRRENPVLPNDVGSFQSGQESQGRDQSQPEDRPPLRLTLKLPPKKTRMFGKANKLYRRIPGNNYNAAADAASRKARGRPPKFRILGPAPDIYLPQTSEGLGDPNGANLEGNDKAEVIFKCPHCVYKSNCQSRIQAHIEKAHCRNRVFVCNICNYECKWNREYYLHMRQHFQGPPFRCDTCDYTAERIQMLLTHRMKHTDERPYKCTQCDYRCRTKTNLVAHLRSHTGEKPFSCPECGRGFAIKSTLDQHLATHSDTRPFRCEQCSFSTKYQSHLISHKRIHTGDVFHCQFTDCNYSSPKKSQLAAHLRTHLAVRAHSCKICGRAFIEKGSST